MRGDSETVSGPGDDASFRLLGTVDFICSTPKDSRLGPEGGTPVSNPTTNVLPGGRDPNQEGTQCMQQPFLTGLSPGGADSLQRACSRLQIPAVDLESRNPSPAFLAIAGFARRGTKKVDIVASPIHHNLQGSGAEVQAYRLSVGLRATCLTPQTHPVQEDDQRPVIAGNESVRRVLWHILHVGSVQTNKNQVQADEWQIPPCGFIGCDQSCVGRVFSNSDFRLEKIFAKFETRLPAALPSTTIPGSGLVILPDEALELIARRLSPRTFYSFASTCRTVQHALAPLAPGLKLRLFDHQSGALRRMLQREQVSPAGIVQPLCTPFPKTARKGNDNLTGDEFFLTNCYMDDTTGAVFLGDISAKPDFRGGLFCDEPGLGKTITAVALILRTLGQIPRAPNGTLGDLIVDEGCEKGDRARDSEEQGPGVAEDRRSPMFAPDSERERKARSERRFYRQALPGRFLPFGSQDSSTSPSGTRNRRNTSTRRRIKAPDFLHPSTGASALPAFGHGEVSIHLSGATLVVVPPVLASHWAHQIAMHVEPNTLRVLVLDSAADIPEAYELAHMYDVVVVTFKVVNAIYAAMREEAPSLLRVRFLRVILDEGHKLGASRNCISNFARVCESLNTERRWIMTGTPTPQTTNTDARHLFPLLQFLKDETYGQADRSIWLRGIERPYEAFQPEALDRLNDLLGRIMIRSSKMGIAGLPPCQTKDVILDFTKSAAASYNDLVLTVRRNLVLSDWESPESVDSLLNPKNAKSCSELIDNLRAACNYGGVIKMDFDAVELGQALVTVAQIAKRCAGIGPLSKVQEADCSFLSMREAWEEMGDSIAQTESDENAGRQLVDTSRSAIPSSNFEPMRSGTHAEVLQQGQTHTDHASRLQETVALSTGLVLPTSLVRGTPTTYVRFAGMLRDLACRLLNGSNCDACGSFCRAEILSTCGHVVCVNCFRTSRTGCTVKGCDHQYMLDSNGIPEEVIELQPSIVSAGNRWVPDFRLSESAKMGYLLKRLDAIGDVMVRSGEGWAKRRPKVIIFSQFKMHHHLLAATLLESKYRYAYVELFANERERDDENRTRSTEARDARAVRVLQGFVQDPEKHILLLDTTHGSVGLDLSFVEYVFLLEPIWDSSLEQQVIARAHRLGAKHVIHVERLAMRGSIEEDMLSEKDRIRSGVITVRKAADLSRRNSLLQNLSPVKAGESATRDMKGQVSSQDSDGISASDRTGDSPDGGDASRAGTGSEPSAAETSGASNQNGHVPMQVRGDPSAKQRRSDETGEPSTCPKPAKRVRFDL